VPRVIFAIDFGATGTVFYGTGTIPLYVQAITPFWVVTDPRYDRGEACFHKQATKLTTHCMSGAAALVPRAADSVLIFDIERIRKEARNLNTLQHVAACSEKKAWKKDARKVAIPALEHVDARADTS
jgi:hypothetical protein